MERTSILKELINNISKQPTKENNFLEHFKIIYIQWRIRNY